MVMPITPPTHEWVVDTGISYLEAKSSHAPTEMITHIMPCMSAGGLSAKHSESAMPLRMVSVTRDPSKKAPRNSKTAPMHTAWRMVSDLDPTDVANALATSLAPMPYAALNAKIPPM